MKGERLPIEADFFNKKSNPAGSTTHGFIGFSRFMENQSPKRGLADYEGNVLIPAEYNGIEPAGEGLWRVSQWDVKTGNRWGLYDSDGRALIKPSFVSIGEFHENAALATTTDYRSVLIDRHGAVLASFDRLFPTIAKRTKDGDGISKLLDLCYAEDPTAEPGASETVPSGLSRLCGDSALVFRSYTALKAYYVAQALPCNPAPLLPVLPRYLASLKIAKSNKEVGLAIDQLQQTVSRAASSCDRPIQPLPADRGVPAALQASLKRLILSSIKDAPKYKDDDFTWRFTSIGSDKNPMVLGTYQCDECSNYAESWHWILKLTPSRRWHVALSISQADIEGVLMRKSEITDIVATSIGNSRRGSTSFYRVNGRSGALTMVCDVFADDESGQMRACTPHLL
jgi:hypothetical protein